MRFSGTSPVMLKEVARSAIGLVISGQGILDASAYIAVILICMYNAKRVLITDP